jgi:hypothetical protein
MLFIVRKKRPNWCVSVDFIESFKENSIKIIKAFPKCLLKIDYDYIARRLDIFVNRNSHCSCLHTAPAASAASSTTSCTPSASRYLFLRNFFSSFRSTKPKDKVFAARKNSACSYALLRGIKLALQINLEDNIPLYVCDIHD